MRCLTRHDVLTAVAVVWIVVAAVAAVRQPDPATVTTPPHTIAPAPAPEGDPCG